MIHEPITRSLEDYPSGQCDAAIVANGNVGHLGVTLPRDERRRRSDNAPRPW